jgi:hypothetical protein
VRGCAALERRGQPEGEAGLLHRNRPGQVPETGAARRPAPIRAHAPSPEITHLQNGGEDLRRWRSRHGSRASLKHCR